MIPATILCNAIETFGVEAQMDMAIEECSELTNAICKLRRGRNTDEDVITEIADVAIMAEQLTIIFGRDKVEAEKRRKLLRLEERINNHNKK